MLYPVQRRNCTICMCEYSACVSVYAQDMHVYTQMLFPPVAFSSLRKISEAAILVSSASPKICLHDFVAFSYYFS